MAGFLSCGVVSKEQSLTAIIDIKSHVGRDRLNFCFKGQRFKDRSGLLIASAKFMGPEPEYMGRRVPPGPFFERERIAVDYHGGNVQERKLDVSHRNAFQVNVGRSDVDLGLVVEPGLFHFQGERQDHGTTACGWLSDRKVAAFR